MAYERSIRRCRRCSANTDHWREALDLPRDWRLMLAVGVLVWMVNLAVARWNCTVCEGRR